jgi:hypothetical protein
MWRSFRWHRLVLLSVLFVITGCVHTPVAPIRATTPITAPSVVQQQWHITRDDEQIAVGVVIEQSPTHWQWIMMNSLGQRVATVTSNGTTIDYRYDVSHRARHWVPDLVALWQLSYWPLDGLAQQGWRGDVSASGRHWWFSDILRATITYDAHDGDNTAPLTGQFTIESDVYRVRIQTQRLK